MLEKLYKARFEIFFFTMLSILFGSLIFPLDWFEDKLMPLLFLLNIASGILLISRKKKLMWFFILLFVSALIVLGGTLIQKDPDDSFDYFRLAIYFVFYVAVTLEIIKQVWKATFVNKTVIIGLMSGYVSMGLIAFLMFLSIEITTPGSFTGLLMESGNMAQMVDSLLYYSYITMLTIGYGEIIPVTPIAQKAAILTGLVGQFYIVIITAVVVEKYIRHSVKTP